MGEACQFRQSGSFTNTDSQNAPCAKSGSPPPFPAYSRMDAFMVNNEKKNCQAQANAQARETSTQG
jgi:hypothetical protein